MTSLFDEEQIIRTYIKDVSKDMAKEKSRETAKRMIKKGKMSLEEIADYMPALSLEELKELEAEIMQLT